MYSYTKEILQKVSFDPALFQKELRKARITLNSEDYNKLLIWLSGYVKTNPDLQYCLAN